MSGPHHRFTPQEKLIIASHFAMCEDVDSATAPSDSRWLIYQRAVPSKKHPGVKSQLYRIWINAKTGETSHCSSMVSAKSVYPDVYFDIETIRNAPLSAMLLVDRAIRDRPAGRRVHDQLEIVEEITS